MNYNFRKKRENLNLSTDIHKNIILMDSPLNNLFNSNKKKKAKTFSNKELPIHNPCPIYPKMKNPETSQKSDLTNLYILKKSENCNESTMNVLNNTLNSTQYIEDIFPKYLNEIENSISTLKKCYLSFCKKKKENSKKSNNNLQNFTAFLYENMSQNQSISKMSNENKNKIDIDNLKKLYFKFYNKETNDIQELYDFYKKNFEKNEIKPVYCKKNDNLKENINIKNNSYENYSFLESPKKKEDQMMKSNLSPINKNNNLTTEKIKKNDSTKKSESHSSSNIIKSLVSPLILPKNKKINKSKEEEEIFINSNSRRILTSNFGNSFCPDSILKNQILRENFFKNKMRSSTSMDKLTSKKNKIFNFSMPLEAKKNLINKIKTKEIKINNQQELKNDDKQNNLKIISEKNKINDIKEQLNVKNKGIYQFVREKLEKNEQNKLLSKPPLKSKIKNNDLNKKNKLEKENQFINEIENFLDDSNFLNSKTTKNDFNKLNNEKFNEKSFFEGLNKVNQGILKDIDLSTNLSFEKLDINNIL